MMKKGSTKRREYGGGGRGGDRDKIMRGVREIAVRRIIRISIYVVISNIRKME